MGGKGGGGGEVRYEQTPEQRQVYQALLPGIQRMGQVLSGLPEGGQEPLYPVPEAPSLTGKPSAFDYMSPTPGQLPSAFDYVNPGVGQMPSTFQYATPAPQYQVPSTQGIMPTSQWWSDLSPQVKQGLWSPYQEAGQQLMEVMGSRGQLGSAGGGFSGGTQAAMGKFAAEAAKNVGLQAWQMTAPGAMAGWQAQLERGRLGDQRLYGMGMQDYQTALQSAQTGDVRRFGLQGQDYQSALARAQLEDQRRYGMGGQDYQTAIQQAASQDALSRAMWQQQVQATQMPWGMIPGMLGGTYSNAIVGQDDPNWAQAIGGGLMGGGMGYMLGAGMTTPMGLPMAALFGLGGLLSGL